MKLQFLFIGNTILSFTTSFLLVETIISSKIWLAKNEDFFEKYFSTRRKKTGKDLEKMEEKYGFH